MIHLRRGNLVRHKSGGPIMVVDREVPNSPVLGKLHMDRSSPAQARVFQGRIASSGVCRRNTTRLQQGKLAPCQLGPYTLSNVASHGATEPTHSSASGAYALQRILRAVLEVFPLLVLLSNAVHAGERTWPQLNDGDTRNGICNTALAIAGSMYRSDDFYLYALPNLRLAAPFIEFALRPEGTDVSGGDALVADQSVFQKIPKRPDGMPSPRSIYWQIKPQLGLRYVMVEDPFGWRGDQYTLFAVNEGMTLPQLLGSHTSPAVQPLVEQTWRPPLMLRKPNGEVWAIDVGPPYVVFSDWKVYSVGADGAKKRCTVKFHGQNKLGPALLPRRAQRFAQLLDQSLDDKDDEGTLHFVTGLRQYITYLWTNIALRPQAIVKEDPDVSRTMADTEFGKWAEGTPRLQKLRREISDQFPVVQIALAGYYKDNMRMADEPANAAAERALDIVFRSYFMKPAR